MMERRRRMLKDLFRSKEQRELALRKKRRSDSARRAAATRLRNKQLAQEFPEGGVEKARERLVAQTTVIDAATGRVTEVPHDITPSIPLDTAWDDEDGN